MTSTTNNTGKKLQGNSVWRVSFVAAFFVLSFTDAKDAHAGLTLRVFDTAELVGSAITVADNSARDSDSTLGSISFSSLPADLFEFEAVLALGVGSDGQLTASDISANTAGSAGSMSFDATFTGNTFTQVSYQSDILGGTFGSGGGSVSVTTYIDNTNTLFGTGSLIASHGPFTSTPFSDSVTTATPLTSPYSTSIYAIIGLDAPFSLVTFTAKLKAVPEPSTVALGLMGMLMLGMIRRRNRRR